MTQSPKIIVALDFENRESAEQLIQQLDPAVCHLKVGKAMFTQYGPTWVSELVHRGFKIFLDLKFFDIPQQVAKACRAAADLGVWMVDVHALGGSRMMAAAVESLQAHRERPLLVAVTLLTSLNQADLTEVGLGQPSLVDQVKRLAQLAQTCGLDGVVCSPQELTLLRHECGKDFQLVTPGIRWQTAPVSIDDQQRTLSPREAMLAGANCLVIGRPITQAQEPMKVLAAIQKQLLNA